MSTQSLQRVLYPVKWVKTKLAKLEVYETLSLLISLLSLASVLLLYHQIKQTSISLKASANADIKDAYANIGAFTLEVDKIFIDRPELRPYFYQGWDITEKDEHYPAAMGVAEMQLDVFDAALTQLEMKPAENAAEMEAEGALWAKYFSKSFATSRVLCKRLADDKDWYRENLRYHASESCKKWGYNVQ